MEVYIKESLLVLDYKDNIVDAIFLSNDNMTPGYAYDINKHGKYLFNGLNKE